MLKMVDGTGIIGVDMICPLGISTPQPPNHDRVELEGTGMLVLPNSLDAPLERLELGGKTEQVQTSGKNLANPSEFVIGNLAGNTGNIINLKQYITTGHIPVIPGKRYSTSCGNKFSAHTIIAYDKEKTKINSLINVSSEMPEGAAYIRQAYRKIDMTNVTESDMEELKKVCMVNEGSTVLPYEPYTGGKPSPSPEYPQEILNAGRLNEDTGKYEVDVKVNGGNLFNKTNIKKGYYHGEIGENYGLTATIGYSYESDINIKAGTEITLSIRSNINTRPRLYAVDSNGIILYIYLDSSNNSADNSHTFTIPNGTRKILVSVLEISDSKDATITVNIGKTPIAYEPYKEQTLTLTSDRPITKWDRLVEQGGQIGWLYKGKIESIPKTGWVLHAQGYFYRDSIFLDSVVNNVPKNEVNLFTHFRLDNPTIADNKDVAWLCVVAPGNTSLRVRLADEKITTALEFEQYISDKDIQILYETESTEFIPLPQSEQNAIRALKTYYPTTVITVDGGELDPDIKVTYRKEI